MRGNVNVLNVSSTGSIRIKMREYEHYECEYE